MTNFKHVVTYFTVWSMISLIIIIICTQRQAVATLLVKHIQIPCKLSGRGLCFCSIQNDRKDEDSTVVSLWGQRWKSYDLGKLHSCVLLRYVSWHHANWTQCYGRRHQDMWRTQRFQL